MQLVIVSVTLPKNVGLFLFSDNRIIGQAPVILKP
jgi:hypothetical protein